MCPPALRPAVVVLLAMMAAQGTSVLRNVYVINRGYEDLAERLNALGATDRDLPRHLSNEAQPVGARRTGRSRRPDATRRSARRDTPCRSGYCLSDERRPAGNGVAVGVSPT